MLKKNKLSFRIINLIINFFKCLDIIKVFVVLFFVYKIIILINGL